MAIEREKEELDDTIDYINIVSQNRAIIHLIFNTISIVMERDSFIIIISIILQATTQMDQICKFMEVSKTMIPNLL